MLDCDWSSDVCSSDLGERQEFSRGKLAEGFRRALHKRPVSTELREESIERVVQRLLALGEREVTARHIGDLVMSELKRLDKVAYIRFASVYRAFQDVDDFRDAIRDVEKS
jgi:transcriptional repressor NrdR